MAQGKLKAKTKLPNNVQNKKKTAKKGSAITKRANRPVQPKKKDLPEVRKLKQIVNKTVNKSVEEEIRSKVANENSKVLSRAQQAVVDHNKKNLIAHKN